MLINISLKNVKKLKKYHTNNLNTQSKLYTDDKYIYKIMDEFPEGFDKTLEKISDADFDFTVKPVHLIEDNGTYVGYSTIDTKEKTLFNYRRRPLDLKKKDLLKAFDLIEELAENNMTYSDFHPGNVLVDDKFKKMRLCDLDNIQFTDNKDSKKHHYLRGFGLLLSYYYNVTGEEARVAVINSNKQVDEDNIFRDTMQYIGKNELKDKVKRFENMSDEHYKYYRHEVVEVYNDRARSGYIRNL